MQGRQYLGIDQDRTVKFGSAVHDAMANRDSHRCCIAAVARRRTPAARPARRVSVAVKAAVDKLDPTGPARTQSRLRADTVDLSLDLQCELVRPFDRKYLKLDAG